MLRTPPKSEGPNRINYLPSGSPSAVSDDEVGQSSGEDEEETPKPPSSNFGELDALTNEEILKHIHLLQLLLQKRGITNNPRNLSAEFGPAPKGNTAGNAPLRSSSPMDADCSFSSSSTNFLKPTSRKRQASSPGRITVEAQVHSEGRTQGGTLPLPLVTFSIQFIHPSVSGNHGRALLLHRRLELLPLQSWGGVPWRTHTGSRRLTHNQNKDPRDLSRGGSHHCHRGTWPPLRRLRVGRSRVSPLKYRPQQLHRPLKRSRP